MKIMRILAAAAGIACLSAITHAAELGDAAPELKVTKWVKGEPVKVAGDDDKVYVVEFWATWCGPCKTSIPHLTELQKKFAEKGVVIIGVTDEKEGVVNQFVKKQGDKMDYRVVLDDKRGTSTGYMEAFEQGGIPHAFIVQKKKVIWHGHPMDGLDQALEEITTGKYSIDSAKKKKASANLVNQYMVALLEEKNDEAEKLVEKIKELDPTLDLAEVRKDVNRQKIVGTYLNAAATDKKEQADELAAKVAEMIKGEPQMENEIAWLILTDPRIKYRDRALAAKIAKQAMQETKSEEAPILDTYARALFEQGQKEEAVKYQEMAVAKAQDKTKYEQTLASYKEGKLPSAE